MNTYSCSDDDLFLEKCGPFLLAAFSEIEVDRERVARNLYQEFGFRKRQLSARLNTPFCAIEMSDRILNRRIFSIFQDYYRCASFEPYTKATINSILHGCGSNILIGPLIQKFKESGDRYEDLFTKLHDCPITEGLAAHKEAVSNLGQCARDGHHWAGILACCLERKGLDDLADVFWNCAWHMYLAESDLWSMWETVKKFKEEEGPEGEPENYESA